MAYQYQRKPLVGPSEGRPLTFDQWLAYAIDSGRLCSRDEAVSYFRNLEASKKK